MSDFNLSRQFALLSVEQRDELEQLLQPISEYYPSGPPIRFDPVFTRIHLARQEDDPGLPMGAWERPLKRVDWVKVEVLCADVLTSRAKDLQIAAWLTEAWCRQQGIEGLLRGLLLVQGLLVRFWETVHPQVDEDGDPELRVAPLQWMDTALSRTTRTMIPLLGSTAGELATFTFADWERMVRDEMSSTKHDGGGPARNESGEAQRTRADVIDYATSNLGAAVDRNIQLVRACVAVVMAIEGFTAARLGADAPAISRLRETLGAMERVMLEMTATREHDITSRQDAAQTPAEPVDPTAQPKDARPDDAIPSNAAQPADTARPEPADQLTRRIDAVCKAAGIDAPSGSERLMAMQIGLLHDQNMILQGLMNGAARRAAGDDPAEEAGNDFTALMAAVMHGRFPAG